MRELFLHYLIIILAVEPTQKNERIVFAFFSTYLVLHLNLPLGVIMYILGGLKGNSLGKTSFPWYVPPEMTKFQCKLYSKNKKISMQFKQQKKEYFNAIHRAK